tara:strand:+ start:6609 stop:7319 length:711 start_codon:yes stop_codon:yes gene_type:complete
MESNSVSVVQLKSVIEERLKFRVIVGMNGRGYQAVGRGRGVYNFMMPPLTSLGNSSRYEQCLIKLETFCGSPVQIAGANPVWTVTDGAGLVNNAKLESISVELGVPSSQVCHTAIGANNGALVSVGGVNNIGGFRQLVQLQQVRIGDATGAVVDPATGFPTPEMMCWSGQNYPQDSVLCANPFGNMATIQLSNAIQDSSTCYIASSAGVAPQNDMGHYVFSFMIEMIPQPGGGQSR